MSDRLRLERSGRTATLTVDHPPLNVLDLGMLAELGEAVETLAGQADLALVIVQAAGARAFSAGVSVQDHTADKVADMLDLFHRALAGLAALPAPSLAVVRGRCLGGGMELALACDWVLAAETATFGQPEIELGCFPPYAAALYPGRIGRARTLELLTLGRLLSGREAAEWGLATWSVPEADLEGRRAEIVARVEGLSAPVVRLAKRAVEAGDRRPFAEALTECERLYLQELAATQDMGEGLAAFLEKRRPTWRHR
ncbi:MAG TPA: enoyl-CoA hydratase-related protein [Thermoanaerobaculia bacterium]|nr:enoyl-CoA hydratase-related protein [Thermoanaerobaculia bacterium]